MSAVFAENQNSFLFFYHFVHRHNILLDSQFDRLQSSYKNMGTHAFREEPFGCYLDVFNTYYAAYKQNIHLFWYICVLYFVSTEALQRFYTFLAVETWKVNPEWEPMPYDEVRHLSKYQVLIELRKYVDQGEAFFFMLIKAISVFF